MRWCRAFKQWRWNNIAIEIVVKRVVASTSCTRTTKFQFIVSPRPIWNPLVESCADFNTGTEYVTSIRAVGAKATEKPPPTAIRGTHHVPHPPRVPATMWAQLAGLTSVPALAKVNARIPANFRFSLGMGIGTDRTTEVVATPTPPMASPIGWLPTARSGLTW